jgi:hypothetical protein
VGRPTAPILKPNIGGGYGARTRVPAPPAERRLSDRKGDRGWARGSGRDAPSADVPALTPEREILPNAVLDLAPIRRGAASLAALLSGNLMLSGAAHFFL